MKSEGIDTVLIFQNLWRQGTHGREFMGLNVKYKLLQNLWESISDINTYWSKALQRLAFIFMGLKFLIQTVKFPDQNSWAYLTWENVL